MNASKYKAFPSIPIQSRMWPNKRIEKAPIWCSVDLRDGNQALIDPMGIETKLAFFELLVKLGFKEIEIGFPSASDTEYDFIRRLIDEKRIPDDVTIQVLCQAREKLVRRTMECIKGAPSVIFHIYNSTSPAQRKYTFGKSKEEIIKIATDGVKCIKDCMKDLSEDERNRIRLEYSPESFSMTEIDYAIEICEAVGNEWGWSKDRKIIFNLPTTVECYTPNIYADSIEYFASKISHRDSVIISTHCHNDRGTGVASCELGLLAGADRVEGCLFGNGERTGNLDIVTVALNMFSEGVDPQLDFSNLPDIADSYQEYTKMEINPRSPYAGGLAYTALSGGHQDAIAKGFAARAKMPEDSVWDVPYLLIDPHDIGRKYEGIIRINSQSGKGGASFILEHNYGYSIPKAMQGAIGELIKAKSDEAQRELQGDEILKFFEDQWINKKTPLSVLDLASTQVESADEKEHVACRGVISWNGEKHSIGGKGNGPLDSFVAALASTPVPKFNITAFHEHSVGQGSDTYAVAYVQITKEDGTQKWGVGKSSNVGKAGIGAVVSALNQ
ncbi:2-isopropylmalate synthase [uncultured Treponema sp.]|uniref:2-isopropylmalate synthase n=1 Tax=uncultured Treponema sp. TaxID=162155 RepID=UPI0025F2795D|nr:2-isopropylmalate synthase [uncultured Treponema sp.]